MNNQQRSEMIAEKWKCAMKEHKCGKWMQLCSEMLQWVMKIIALHIHAYSTVTTVVTRMFAYL